MDEPKNFWKTFQKWLLDLFYGPASSEKNHEQLTPKKFNTGLSPKCEAAISEAKMAKPKKKKPIKRKKPRA